MEVDESSIRFPSTDHTSHAGIVERTAKTHPALQVVTGADIVAWKQVDPAQPTEQGIFSRPPPYSAQRHKPGHRLFVTQIRQCLQVQPACGKLAAKFEQRAGLGAA